VARNVNSSPGTRSAGGRQNTRYGAESAVPSSSYSSASPLEQLLINHILTIRLRLNYVENAYNRNIVNESVSLNVGVYWDNLLTSNRARFTRAIETFARVRRFARNTPALQVNIAREGGKQVNVKEET
jgi:hypothetical protein